MSIKNTYDVSGMKKGMQRLQKAATKAANKATASSAAAMQQVVSFDEAFMVPVSASDKEVTIFSKGSPLETERLIQELQRDTLVLLEQDFIRFFREATK